MGRLARPIILVLALCAAAAEARGQRGLKVYISSDMEGVAGAVTGDQLGPAGFEYGRFREFMTAEVLAAIQAAREAGATEIVVGDSHGNGENLLFERFPADVRVVRAWPRPLGMVQGIDSTFDAAILLGYHASTDNPAGVRAHTLSSANYTSVKLNGTVVPEAGLSAAVAGEFGVPVVMISGDDAAVAEAQRLLGPVEGAVVKQNYGFHSAITMTPEAAQALIRERVRAALSRRGELRPFVMRGPVRLDVSFKSPQPVELLSYLPGVQRTDAHTIRFTGRNMLEVSRFLQFIGHYQAGLQP